MMKKLVLLLLLTIVAPGLLAGEAEPMAEDPVVEAKVMKISKELRCLVCQNQTIADSHAPLAVDLRREVRDMVKKGMDQEQVVSFMEERYGDFVRYRPAFRGSTLLLWVGPLILFAIALAVLYYFLLRKRKNVDETTPFTDEEKARIAVLLKQENTGEDKA
jgi:cytochrome c-type biogenesis protein CcmH